MSLIIKSIRKRPLNIILIQLAIVAYLINNLFFKVYTSGAVQHFFVCYFNDLICPLLFFSYMNILLITLNIEINKLWTVLLIAICIGCVWELITPLIKTSSIRDPVDFLCYIIGSVLYWLILCFTSNIKDELYLKGVY